MQNKSMIQSKRERQLFDLRKYELAEKALESHLLDFSNLPSKRGNIELAFSFADYVEVNYGNDKSKVFNYCRRLISENNEVKKDKGNEEFLPFCAIVALGRIGKIDQNKKDEVLEVLKENAKDGRWRIREAVAMAIQELMDVNPKGTIEKLKKWADEDNYLIHRAVLAGLAEPRLMKNKEIARASLEIHKEIIEKVEKEKNSKDIEYKVLVKGLCYTLSVTITGIEGEGFSCLEELMNKNNPIITKIVRENLKKDRLKRLNESKVSELQEKLRVAV